MSFLFVRHLSIKSYIGLSVLQKERERETCVIKGLSVSSNVRYPSPSALIKLVAIRNLNPQIRIDEGEEMR